jgi:hypothetical protein
MISKYPFSEDFQARLLALMIQEPAKVLHVVRARHFTSPIYMDIARIATEAYEKHGTETFRLSKAALMQLIKKFLGRKRRDVWHVYRKYIKRLYKISLQDEPILLEQVREFAKEGNYRQALVEAEKQLNRQEFKQIDRIFEELRTSRDGQDGSKVLQARDFQTPHRLQRSVLDNTWLIENFIPDNGLTLFVGAPESAKSLASLLWEYSVVKHHKFLGLHSRWTTVLHIDCENGIAEIKRRCELFNIKFAPELLFWSLDDPNLGPPPQLPNPIYEDFATRGWVLVFDSLAFQTSGKVIKAEDIVPILYEFKRLSAKTGVPVIAIHHSSDKDDRNTYLGSTFIRASLDAGYFVETTKDPRNGDRQLVEFYSIKGRRGGMPELSMQLDFADGTYWKVRSTHEEAKREPMQILADVIESNPQIVKEELIARSKLPRHKARKLLQLGEGKYWRAVKVGDKNRLRYELLKENS